MFPHRNLNKRLILGSASLLVALCTAFSAMAHKVEVSGDVGGTSHIEPNDNPRAGTPSLAWFALTQKGGTLIPLENCNCQLAVYAEPRATNPSPIQQPTLTGVSVEGYEGIPGAEITFPQVGAYMLVISGSAIAPATFQPFELQFPVTVVAGQPSASPSPTQASEPTTDSSPAIAEEANSSANNSLGWLGWVLGAGVVFGAVIFLWIGRHKRSSKK
jgi:hypothetical protein